MNPRLHEAFSGASLIRWIGTTLIVAPAALVVVLALEYAGPMRKVYADFDLHVPPLTQFVYDWYGWTLAFVALIVPLRLLTRPGSGETGARASAWIGWLAAFALYLIWLAAMGAGLYLPFYQLSLV